MGFEAVKERSFTDDFRGHYTVGKSYPYYLDAAMVGRGV